MSRKYGIADFIALLAPVVIQVRREGSPLLPSVRLAQSWLETGGSVNDWNNLGGYKAGGGSPNAYWRGDVVNKNTWEAVNGQTVHVVAAFRAYDSIYDFYKDQDLLFMRSRYAPVRAAVTPEQQARALQSSGYATDPDYAGKLIAIIAAYGLIRYDTAGTADGEEEAGMTTEEKAAFEALRTRVEQLEKLTNIAADRQPPAWAYPAMAAAMQAGIMTSMNDKGHAELVMIQMMYNAGLCNAELIAFFKAFSPQTRAAIEKLTGNRA